VPGDGRGGGEEGGIDLLREASRALAGLTILLGVGMLLFTATHGGGIGVVLGVLFVAAGSGRLYLLRRRRQ
jgi:hypothetical protein